MTKTITTKCKVCECSLKSFGSLSKHLRDQHKINPKEYYVEHCGVGSCAVCGKETKFVNINVGYKKTCSHKCGSILHRQELRNDPEKFEQFRERVTNNMIELHANITDEDLIKRRALKHVDTVDYSHIIGNAELTDKSLRSFFNI